MPQQHQAPPLCLRHRPTPRLPLLSSLQNRIANYSSPATNTLSSLTLRPTEGQPPFDGYSTACWEDRRLPSSIIAPTALSSAYPLYAAPLTMLHLHTLLSAQQRQQPCSMLKADTPTSPFASRLMSRTIGALTPDTSRRWHSLTAYKVIVGTLLRDAPSSGSFPSESYAK
ncbi:hypothetical protein NMY22_g13070 [Coprinellus aureogranulatus]|nr:hypothetical protein NMY22_g13070 [Coprinellus aureogranulatus]